jgi:hypothetical protein
VNPDEAFAYWYNDGDRRTFGAVAEHFEVAYNTIRNYSDSHDWPNRADEIDAETRRHLDKRLAHANARALERELQALMALEAKFMRRLVPLNEDGTPNPAAINPGDVAIHDLLAIIRTRLQIAHGVVDPLAQGGERRVKSLEEIEAEIAALDMAALETGGTE